MSADNFRKPNYSGYDMSQATIDPKCLDEDGEETTRRIAFNPSFEPVVNFASVLAASRKEVIAAITESSSTSISEDTAPSIQNKGFWNLNDVPTLPEFHQLERTAVFVPNSTSGVVSMRVSDVLRQRSIESICVDEQAKVKCINADGVDFRVKLYRGRELFSHGIIVEIQRRFGTSNRFHADVKAILDAAEGKVPSPPLKNTNLPIILDSNDEYEPNGLSSLNFVSKMLNNETYDTYNLGLQILVALTDDEKMGHATAYAVAKELLSSEESDVGVKVLSLILEQNNEDELYKFRSTALNILANSIQAVEGKIHHNLWDQLRPVLLDELRNAFYSPRNAFQAARAIQCFVSQDQHIADIHAALEIAHAIGASRHANLEQETQRCLDTIR